MGHTAVAHSNARRRPGSSPEWGVDLPLIQMRVPVLPTRLHVSHPVPCCAGLGNPPKPFYGLWPGVKRFTLFHGVLNGVTRFTLFHGVLNSVTRFTLFHGVSNSDNSRAGSRSLPKPIACGLGGGWRGGSAAQNAKIRQIPDFGACDGLPNASLFCRSPRTLSSQCVPTRPARAPR